MACGLALPLAQVPCRAVPAARALSGAGVTEVGVAVALAGAAAGEAPLARLAVGALAARGSGTALALARRWVTLVAQRALRVAVTGWGLEGENKGVRGQLLFV